MQERAKPQIDIEINPQASGKWAIVISLIALVFSAISLYESLLRQPHVTLNTAGTWLYARGEATEELSVPLTLTNSGGARGNGALHRADTIETLGAENLSQPLCFEWSAG